MREDTSARNSDRVRQALACVAGRLTTSDGGPTLEELARQARTAPFYLHRVFREATGEPVQGYIRRLRLEYAAYQLLVTDQPVLDIALGAGYESNAAFTRAFKRWYGTAPAAFRAEPDTARPSEPGQPPQFESAPRRMVAFARYFGSYADTGRAWQTLAGELTGRGVDPAGVTAVGIVYDGPEYCLGERVRYDACAVLDGVLPGGHLGIRLLPQLRTAGAVHTGPPELVACTYVRLVVQLAMRCGNLPAARLPFYEIHQRFPLGPPDATGVRVVVG